VLSCCIKAITLPFKKDPLERHHKQSQAAATKYENQEQLPVIAP